MSLYIMNNIKILQYHQLFSLGCALTHHDLFITESLYLLIPSTYSIHPFPLATTSSFTVYVFFFFLILVFFFFNVDHSSQSLYWICYNIASVLCSGIVAPGHVGILVPQVLWPGIEPVPSTLEARLLTTRWPGKTLFLFCFIYSLCFLDSTSKWKHTVFVFNRLIDTGGSKMQFP